MQIQAANRQTGTASKDGWKEWKEKQGGDRSAIQSKLGLSTELVGHENPWTSKN